MKTYGSLFTGFGGACLGARAAGLELAWGNELDPAIAEVGNFNLGGHIRVGNVLEQNPHDYERVAVLHASPPCPNFSVAKEGGAETALDIALARKVAEFVTVLQPEVFTLENVQAYRKSKSWALIEQTLWDAGYWLSVNVVNSADMGVAQTRRRMIVRAVRGGMVPYLPQPVPWIGWFSAIEDILHTLPDSQFAPWQLARLPEELRSVLIDSKNAGQEFGKLHRTDDEPAFTVTTDGKPSHMPRALLFSNAKTEYSDGTRQGDDPAFTVTGESNGQVKAFLMGKNQDKFGDGIRYAVKPAQTIGANEHGSKAFIVDGKNSGNFGNGPTTLAAASLIFTIQASQAKGMPRAYDGVGRVVAMTPRALARFQSFPDSYVLPDSKTLAAKGIGNAVPPLVMQQVYHGLSEV